MSKEVYLGRAGKVYGPLSQMEFEELKKSEEFKTYSWLWESENSNWVAINPPEAPPTLLTNAAPSGLQVVCHDHHYIVAGVLTQPTDTGFTLISENHAGEMPPFRKGAKLLINLLDERSGQGQNIPVVLQGIAKGSRGWIYHMRWDRIPELVIKAAST